jgi:hypothetical protein
MLIIKNWVDKRLEDFNLFQTDPLLKKGPLWDKIYSLFDVFKRGVFETARFHLTVALTRRETG